MVERGARLACTILLAAACSGDGGPRRDVAPECRASAEVCNGADDDCDGAVDEELAALTCGTGACAATVAGCANGVVPACVPLAPAAAEACDGIDDDCDGGVDEGCECAAGAERSCYPGPAGTAGVGACRAGTQRCDAGRWASCGGAQAPTAETCNEVDDDCDGALDEDACRWAGAKRVTSPGADVVADLSLGSDGAVYVAVASSTPLPQHRGRHLTLRLASWDAAGRARPVRAFEADEAANALERVEATRDAAGNTWVLLSSWKWPPVELLKLDADARLLWRVEAFPWALPYAPSLALDASGIASVTVWAGMEAGWQVRRFGTDGALLQTLPLPPRRTPAAIAAGAGGTVYLTGSASGPNEAGNAFVSRLSPGGTIDWEAFVAPEAAPPDAVPQAWGRHVVVGANGDVSVVGTIASYTVPPDDVRFLGRWSSSGAPLWLRRFEALSPDAPGDGALAAGPEGGLWTAARVGDLGDRAALVDRFDATGARLWRADVGELSELGGPVDVVVGQGGEAWVAGDRVFPGSGAEDTDVFVVKLSAAGAVE